MAPITLLTDFGDFYVSSLKGTLCSLAPDRPVVDLYHDVPRQGVRAAAFVLSNVVSTFPAGTVHCVSVDSSAGADERPIVISAGGQHLVGRDNGALLPASRRLGTPTVYAPSMEVEPTMYHGRDLVAHVAGSIAAGNFSLGNPVDDYADYSIPDPTVVDGAIEGEAVYVDRYGNVLTNVPAELLLDRTSYGETITVNETPVSVEDGFGSTEPGEAACKVGSYGNVVLAVNGGSGSDRFGITIGDRIQIETE